MIGSDAECRVAQERRPHRRVPIQRPMSRVSVGWTRDALRFSR